MSKDDHSDCKALNNLTDMLNRLVKESDKNPQKIPKKQKEPPDGKNHLAKSLRKQEPEVANNKIPKKQKEPPDGKKHLAKGLQKQEPEVPNNTLLDAWLVKKELLTSPSAMALEKKWKDKQPARNSARLLEKKSLMYKESPRTYNKTICSNQEISNNTPTKQRKLSTYRKNDKVNRKKLIESLKHSSSSKQTNLGSFLTNTSSKKSTSKRTDSPDNSELPTFTTTKSEQKALFKKYGVVLPTVNEMLKDKEDLEKEKNIMKLFTPIDDDILEFEPFLEQRLTQKGNVLDCKHLTLKQLTKEFKNNSKYLSDVINGKIKNERHDRYFNKNTSVLTNSVRDLTYNTSTIVFNFEQKEHLLELLKEYFDPEDVKTQYFFQVLLPELCLRIFMKTYKFKYDAAVKYLDKQPIIED